MLTPFKFQPYLRTVLWGGSRIAAYKGWPTAEEGLGESWEISAMPGRESVVKEGADQGLTLSQLVEKYGADLLGRRVEEVYGRRFPLLVKLIDAHRDLSLQVHPDDGLARSLHSGTGKTEMWYVVRADAGAMIYAGFSQAITPEEYDRRVADHSIMHVVARHEAHAGDVIYLPAGCIHTLGAGNLVVEVQQASDITYRVYDYGRRDAAGHLRELHTNLARSALDFSAGDGNFVTYDRAGKGRTPLVHCPYFRTDRFSLCGEASLPAAADAFQVLVCVEGEAVLRPSGGASAGVSLRRGESVLVPAAALPQRMSGSATLLCVTV